MSHLPVYRFFHLTENAIAFTELANLPGDAEAIAFARSKLAGRTIEIWDEMKFVSEVQPDQGHPPDSTIRSPSSPKA